MATQQYIYDQEEKIINAEFDIRELNKALQLEIEDKAGNINKNRESWATVCLNLNSLIREAVKLRDNINDKYLVL